ncbi:hypothetical protein AB0D13_23210 [Streptomyces sp. NPDC048430]
MRPRLGELPTGRVDRDVGPVGALRISLADYQERQQSALGLT